MQEPSIGLVWICIPIIFQRLCPSYHLTGPPNKSVQNTNTVLRVYEWWILLCLGMCGYIRVYMGMLRRTSGKVVNQKILELKYWKSGRVSDWKSRNLEKFQSGQVEQLDRQTDRGRGWHLSRFSTFHNSHFSNFPHL